MNPPGVFIRISKDQHNIPEKGVEGIKCSMGGDATDPILQEATALSGIQSKLLAAIRQKWLVGENTHHQNYTRCSETPRLNASKNRT